MPPTDLGLFLVHSKKNLLLKKKVLLLMRNSTLLNKGSALHYTASQKIMHYITLGVK